jgi:hypothetical protein
LNSRKIRGKEQLQPQQQGQRHLRRLGRLGYA